MHDRLRALREPVADFAAPELVDMPDRSLTGTLGHMGRKFRLWTGAFDDVRLPHEHRSNFTGPAAGTSGA